MKKKLLQYSWLLCSTLVLHNANANPPSEQALQQSETIFQLALGSQIISDGLFAYQLNNHSYLPLGELTRALEFPIMLGPDGQRAEGWFISPRQTFSLNLKNHTLRIKEKKNLYSKSEIFSSEGEIYVSTEQLSHWFGLEFNVSMPSLSINISSKQPLPIQKRAERDKRHNNFKRGFFIAERPNLPYHPTPYQLIATPAASFNLNSSYNQNSHMENSNYSAQLYGDLLYHSGQLFLSGDDQGGLQNLRLQLSKYDFNRQLLGPLNANRYSIGDISVQSRSLIGGNFSGRGFKFSSIPINQSSEFNRITLEGDLQPQYDVELYRNGGLYEFQRSNDEGRYKFDNVPLFQGMNVLKLIFYGPQGQQYEKIQRLYSDGTTAKQGQLNYRFSLTQPSQTVFTLDNSSKSDNQSISWLASANYGLGHNLSATTSLAQYEQNKIQQSYANFGLRGTIGPILAQSEVALDKDGNAAALFSLQTKLGNIRLNLNHNEYSRDFANNRGNDPQQQSNQLHLEGIPFRLSDRSSISLLNFKFNQKRNFSGLIDQNISHNFWLSIGSMNFGNNLFYSKKNVEESQLKGSAHINFNANKMLKGLNLRSSANYTISPNQQTQTATLNASYRFNSQSNINFSTSRNYQQTDNQTLYYDLGYNHRFEKFNLGSTLSGDSNGNGNYYLGVRLSFSILPDPTNTHPSFSSNSAKAQSGSVLARSYVDENRNGKRDFWEKPVTGIGFIINRGYRPGVTNRHGEVLISDLRTGGRKIDIQLNPSTLGDPYLISNNNGYGITPRAGYTMRLDFPLINVGEIDGHVYLQRNGEKIEAANVSLELINSKTQKLITTLHSEYDGYFYLSTVIPGKYQLRVEPKMIKRLGLSAPKPFEIEIEDIGSSVTTPDIILTKEKYL